MGLAPYSTRTTKLKNRGVWEGYEATLPYDVGCQKYADAMFSFLKKHVPVSEWQGLTFADLFAGSGSHAIAAKRYRFGRVLANDYLRICHLANHHVLVQEKKISKENFVIPFLRKEPVSDPTFVQEHYGKYFVVDSAKLIDDFLCRAETELELYYVLRLALLLSAKQWKPPTDKVYYNAEYQRALELYSSPENLLNHICSRLNTSIFPHVSARNRSYCLDYRDFLKTEKKIDIIHLHPPYGYTDYKVCYQVYESIMSKQVIEPEVETKNKNTEFVQEVFKNIKVKKWIVQLTDAKVKDHELREMLNEYVDIIDIFKIERKIGNKYYYFCQRRQGK
jgi:adenine-specific DNA methylase